MKAKIWSCAAIGLLGLVYCVPSQAQRMYRCGNVYQDRPCDGPQVGAEVRDFSTVPPTKPNAAQNNADSECRQRGIDSQKIVWSREAGATAERQIADLSAKGGNASRSEDQRNLIVDVYQKRGSAPEVRTAIEADCIADKRRAELALEALANLKSLSNGRPTTNSVPIAGSDANPDSTSARPVDESAQLTTKRQESICKQFNVRQQSIRDLQRSGGSASTMETLRNQLKSVDAERRSANCP